MRDVYGAFCQHTHVELAGSGTGPLVGLTFAAKDVFHIAGHRTGFGSPEWFRSHGPESSTAPVVQRLLDSGARLVGKTHTDELTYSIGGENYHYGTPINPNALDRIPGGSSSGSAVAVAAGLCDFALGTDSGGSVRTPASFCGVYGMRPSHGRIAMEGIVPHSPSFGTVGWLTREAALCERIGRLLLDDHRAAPRPVRLLIGTDAFALAGAETSRALQPAVERLISQVGNAREVAVSDSGLREWMEAFRLLQAWELWSAFGPWVTRVKPRLGPGIKERFAVASQVTTTQAERSRAIRDQVAKRMAEMLRDNAVLCIPTVPGIAPLRNSPPEDIDAFRYQAFSLLVIAGLAGLPQLSMPLASMHGCPLGLSLIAASGNDAMLLELARSLEQRAA
ncbi:MAG: amidase [Gammaproteobacteria bacterium]